MRIRIEHQTTYAYDTAARSIVQALRLTPRSHEGQQVLSWRIDTDVDTRLRAFDDPFSNLSHNLYTEAPTTGLTIRVTGEVSTHDTGGIIADTIERLPLQAYLRETALTAVTPEIAAYARDAAGQGSGLERMHALLTAVNRDIEFDTCATDSGVSAVEAFALKRGVCQDMAHLFIGAARSLGNPARYVSGYLLRSDGAIDQEAAHAWAEAHVEDLGWVGFDPANGISSTAAYVRVAVALDYLGAAPVRGASYGGSNEQLSVRVRTRQAESQMQS
jgi:transglutaminase-like putative cysteine protease